MEDSGDDFDADFFGDEPKAKPAFGNNNPAPVKKASVLDDNKPAYEPSFGQKENTKPNIGGSKPLEKKVTNPLTKPAPPVKKESVEQVDDYMNESFDDNFDDYQKENPKSRQASQHPIPQDSNPITEKTNAIPDPSSKEDYHEVEKKEVRIDSSPELSPVQESQHE